MSEIVCLHNQNPFNETRIYCLVDRKGIGIVSVIVSNCSQSKKALYDQFDPFVLEIDLKSVL